MSYRVSILCDAVGPGGKPARQFRAGCHSYALNGGVRPAGSHPIRVEAAKKSAARIALEVGWVRAGRTGWKCPHCKELGTTDE